MSSNSTQVRRRERGQCMWCGVPLPPERASRYKCVGCADRDTNKAAKRRGVKRGTYTCGGCGVLGHNLRTCAQRRAS